MAQYHYCAHYEYRNSYSSTHRGEGCVKLRSRHMPRDFLMKANASNGGSLDSQTATA
jgi:hypothetical protein